MCLSSDRHWCFRKDSFRLKTPAPVRTLALRFISVVVLWRESARAALLCGSVMTFPISVLPTTAMLHRNSGTQYLRIFTSMQLLVRKVYCRTRYELSSTAEKV